jgi:hypothetical protein
MSQSYDPFDPGNWADAPGCEAFEIALGMRARGALAPSAEPVLDAHLAACDSCRDFGARMQRVEAALARTNAETSAPSWEQVHKKLTADRNRYRKTMPWIFGGMIVSFLGIGWANAVFLGEKSVPATKVVIAAGLMSLLAAGIYSLAMWRTRRFLEQRDLVAVYRSGLERAVEGFKTTRVFLLIFFAYAVWGWIEDLSALIDERHHAGYWLVKSSLLVAMVGLTSATMWRAARKARRELAELR